MAVDISRFINEHAAKQRIFVRFDKDADLKLALDG